MNTKDALLGGIVKPPYVVSKSISAQERTNWRLIVDAVYEADPEIKNMGAEVISKLMGVRNQGGFRLIGPASSPQYIVLFTSGENIYWQDELDLHSGVFMYYGDQNKVGDINNTKSKGNKVLDLIFELALSHDFNVRKKIPPVFVFKKSEGRDVRFLGLAVPGVLGKNPKEWLSVVWGVADDGNRYVNYKSFFTILDTEQISGLGKNDSGINLAWLNDIKDGHAFESKYAPKAWKDYIEKRKFQPLKATPTIDLNISEFNQVPDKDTVQYKQLKAIHEYFINKDRGYSFEKFANHIVQMWDSHVLDVFATSYYKDGGFDGIGKYVIFEGTTQAVSFDFFVQAKCFDPDKSHGVDHTKRLIARIKHRQFGVFVTTSRLGKQAYKEILEDGHPIVFITGKDITDFIYNKLEIRTVEGVCEWLRNEF